MPGYSRVDQARSQIALNVTARNPVTGDMVPTNLVQCDDCDAVVTAVSTDHHDKFHLGLDNAERVLENLAKRLETANIPAPALPRRRPAPVKEASDG